LIDIDVTSSTPIYAQIVSGMKEGEDFVVTAREDYGYRGAKGAEKLIDGARALFAGGELSDDDKQAVLIALQEAYFEAKRENIKYTPKKYRKED
jgi:hypothetical protein